MQGRILFMPSTPLNVIVSAALAVQFKQQVQSQIWLIDQKNVSDNPYFKALNQWPSSPFDKVELFAGKASGYQKLHERQQNFSALTACLTEFQPEIVAVGSDRRIEFQFVMQQLKNSGAVPQGIYLDDGLYSYAGRESSFIKDAVSSLLKKISYGWWWQEPKTVGASSLIEQAWLFSPEQSIPLIAEKSCQLLQPQWFVTPEISDLSRTLAQQLDFNVSALAELDVVILIAHPNNIEKMPGYAQRVQALISRMHSRGKRVGVKYHPRSDTIDALDLVTHGAKVVIPSQLAFEFCLPVFSENCRVIGDVGTALFTTKWLRPDIEVSAVLDSSDKFQKKYTELTTVAGIRVVNRIEEIE